MKTRLIVNPAAGAGRCTARLHALRPLLRSVWPALEWIESASAEHVAELARATARAGCEQLLVAGGDGTVHHAARGLAGSHTALGIVPLGTGNDVAASVGIPSDTGAAIRALAKGQVRPFDLATANERWFCCVLGVGMDVDALRYINSVRAIRRGALLYHYAALRTLFTHRAQRMQIRADGVSFDGRVLFGAVMNTRTYAGGMRLAPDARIDDGLLDLCVIPDAALHRDALSLWRAVRGRHRGQPGVVLERSSRVVIESAGAVPVTLDGELTDCATPVEVRVRPGALRVLGGVE